MKITSVVMILIAIALPFDVTAQPAVGAAPKGDETSVATRIIKANFPSCEHVSNATRLVDGSIQATCDGTEYRIFTLFDAKSGGMLEVALNCEAAKKHLNISC